MRLKLPSRCRTTSSIAAKSRVLLESSASESTTYTCIPPAQPTTPHGPCDPPSERADGRSSAAVEVVDHRSSLRYSCRRRTSWVSRTWPSAARAESAHFIPSRRTLRGMECSWLRVTGPCAGTPPLWCGACLEPCHSRHRTVPPPAQQRDQQAQEWPQRTCRARPVPFCGCGLRPVTDKRHHHATRFTAERLAEAAFGVHTSLPTPPYRCSEWWRRSWSGDCLRAASPAAIAPHAAGCLTSLACSIRPLPRRRQRPRQRPADIAATTA
eukprot:scaffold8030_cov417-Prasinococcus_capsulatus_cf.AAC.2